MTLMNVPVNGMDDESRQLLQTIFALKDAVQNASSLQASVNGYVETLKNDIGHDHPLEYAEMAALFSHVGNGFAALLSYLKKMLNSQSLPRSMDYALKRAIALHKQVMDLVKILSSPYMMLRPDAESVAQDEFQVSKALLSIIELSSQIANALKARRSGPVFGYSPEHSPKFDYHRIKRKELMKMLNSAPSGPPPADNSQQLPAEPQPEPLPNQISAVLQSNMQQGQPFEP